MASKWFSIVLVIMFLASIVAILIRIDGRKEVDRLEDGDFSADDFDIIE
jgi:hypothetical protein